MTFVRLAIAICILWALSIFALAVGTAHLTTMVDRVALAVVGGLPPLVLWFWWKGPSETMSETIHRGRDDGGAPGPRGLE